ncbi:hypothetical protein LX36DRAFT_30120 [Colletotrichum falcatum]|nr:hypothetical protein LX36DRAFT_30120 [Colletotrichum falcatum]
MPQTTVDLWGEGVGRTPFGNKLWVTLGAIEQWCLLFYLLILQWGVFVFSFSSPFFPFSFLHFASRALAGRGLEGNLVYNLGKEKFEKGAKRPCPVHVRRLAVLVIAAVPEG